MANNFLVNNPNSNFFRAPPNYTRIKIPTEIPLSEAHEGQAVSRLSTPQDFFSWRDVIQVIPQTATQYQMDYCANLADLTKMTVRYNRGNGQYYKCLYRSAQLNGQPSETRISQEQYRQNGVPRTNSILGPVQNQGQCGSCYSFGTTECVSSRMAISTFGRIRTQLSPWFVLNKCTQPATSAAVPNTNQFCGGGDIGGTLRNIEDSTGLASLADYPYPNITNCTSNTNCSNPNMNINLGQQNCGTPSTLYRSYRAHWECTKRVADAMQNNNFDLKTMPGTIVRSTPSDPMGITYWTFDLPQSELDDNMGKILSHLYAEGPVAIGFSVLEDFDGFNTNDPYAIYQPTPGNKQIQGGHAILMVGFGTAADGTKYWELQNSWSESWGDEGFFYMIRGINFSACESNAMGNLVASNPLIAPPALPFPPPTTPTCNGQTIPSPGPSPGIPLPPLNILPIPHPEPIIPPSRIPVLPLQPPSSGFSVWIIVFLILIFIIIILIIVVYLYRTATPNIPVQYC